MLFRLILLWLVYGLLLLALGLIVTILVPLIVLLIKKVRELCNGNNKRDT